MTFKTACIDDTPRYEDGCLAERDRAFTSSEISFAISLVLWFRLSLGSSGIVCNDSKLPSSLDMGETCASTDAEVAGEAGCCACGCGGPLPDSSRSFSRGRLTRASGEVLGNNLSRTLRYSSRVVDSFSTCLLRSAHLFRLLHGKDKRLGTELIDNTKRTYLREGRGSE